MAQSRIQKKDYSFSIAVDETTQTADIVSLNGEVAKLVVTIPDYTNTVTTTISCNNADSKEIFTTVAMAQNDDYDITLARHECLIVGSANNEWKVTLSGVPGGAAASVVTMAAYINR